MHLNLNLGRRIIIYFLGFDLSFVYCFKNRIDECRCRLAERNFLDDQCLVILLFNLGSHFQDSASLAVVIFAYINASTRRKVWIKLKILTAQIRNGCIADFIEIMRKYF